MKFCQNCGKEIMDEAVVCPNCGCAQENSVKNTAKDSANVEVFGWALLGFCVPIAGLILYLVWKDTMPSKAKSAGMGALICVIISIIIYAIYAFIIGISMIVG